MHISAKRHRRRLKAELHGGHREQGTVHSCYYGMLGSVAWPSPSPTERARFWSELDGRLSVIAAKYPDRLDAAGIIKVKTSLARHIPRPAPTRAEDQRRFFEEPAKTKQNVRLSVTTA
jgi:hypothetical protein